MRVAVIPARGGSKRIPRKNVRNFGGKPMIGHSIECALRSGLFGRVLVSTDDEEIAHVSRGLGADVPFMRPNELSDDLTGIVPVVVNAIEWLQARGETLSAVCCIYATAPFIRGEDVAQGCELLESGRWQFVFSATTFPAPIFRSFRITAEGRVELLFPEHFDTRSQDLPEALHDAGQFYWGTPGAWLDHRRALEQSSTVLRIPRWRVQDIDDLEDWQTAEMTWRTMQTRDAER